jgi:hypothetical protein
MLRKERCALRLPLRFAIGLLLLSICIWNLKGTPGEANALAASGNPCNNCANVFDGYATSESESAVRITWVMDHRIRPKAFTLSDPRRLVVDLEPAWTEGLPVLLSLSHPILRGPVRVAWHPELMRLRFVFDLLPGGSYEVRQDLYIAEGQLAESQRFVLTLIHGNPKQSERGMVKTPPR